ncbi:MAG: MATE family efflux transporter [Clostridia bacterium]|nr:MATE family efflux transporter [Clostridia bacterium]
MTKTQEQLNVPTENPLGWEKIGKLLLRFSLPGIISMVINSLYNIVDQIFIGWGVGFLGNGATTVVFPLVTIALAFSLLICDGTASHMSLMLGKKKEQAAAEGVATGMVASVAVSIILAIVFLVFLEPLCWLFGATQLTLPYALEYGRIIAIGLPLSGIAVGFAGFIRADGSPRYNMMGLIVGCVTNIVLDALFILVFKWGIAGAAWATIIGQGANALIYFLYVFKFKTIKITKSTFKSFFKTLPKIVGMGISSFINQAVVVIIVAVQNNLLKTYGAMSEYGAEIPMTALGVTMKVFNIVIAIIIGLNSGAQPILGYNYGSGKHDRVKRTFLYTLLFGTGITVIALIIFQLFPETVVSIFGNEDPLYTDFSVLCLKVYLLAVPLNSVKMIAGAFFQSVGKPFLASVLSLSKQIAIQVPLVILLPMRFGVKGVLYSGPVSDIASFILTAILFAVTYKGIFNKKEKQQIEKGTVIAKTSTEKVRVITIGRTYGAGGRSIGKELARMLNVAYYDTEILSIAAQKSGLDENYLQSVDEKKATQLMLAQRYAQADAYREAEKARIAAIEQAACSSCVIVGRRADKVLKGKVEVFSVFIDSSLEKRVERICARENLSAEESRKKILKVDKERQQYYDQTEGFGWGEASNYNLCLDTTSLSASQAAEIIGQAYKSWAIDR